MDLIKLREIHAMNKSKKHQLLDNFFLYSLTVLTCTLFCSSPFWFPSLFESMKLFLFVSPPKPGSVFLSPKFIFIVGNLIIFVLVGESKFFAPNSPPATGVYYDEYIDHKRSLQTVSSVEQNKETNMEKSSKEKSSRTCENGEKNEGKGLAEGNLKVHKERKYLEEEEEEEDFSLPTEELNKRADDFIARVNRQRMVEAMLLVC
ncbi:hypothetical protein SADUNF_Sadunf12G0079500 [Salix dunnii]|uniref:DUF4408 domain-containing protein n=1 Tax=Salix dunnii TaxID=1413687 RepID=A0A835MW51_9ROSI|nr:hypothetical protein SADUNF_Sadunf12G0079500 [Salix dunnii]